MKIIDISWPISNQIVTYKNKADVSIQTTREFSTAGCLESKISCGNHTGTHVDAPAHFLPNGKTLDQCSIEGLIGLAQVIDLMDVDEKITYERLMQVDFAKNCKILLFKTKNSLQAATGSFEPNFIYLDGQAAAFLATKNITAVGIDGLGIERNQPERDTHINLLQKDILIIEGLRLAHVQAGNYQLFCLPLKLIGTEAAPARAILIADHDFCL